MEKLFDLDELHREHRKRKFITVSIASIVFIVGIISLANLVPRSHNSNATASLAGSVSPISSDAGTTQAATAAMQRSTNSGGQVQPAPNNYSPSYSYVVPSDPQSAQSTASVAAPDPSKCPDIKAQMAGATTSLDAQAARLSSQIQNEQSYITNNSSYRWQNGYGQGAPPDTSAEQAQLNHDQQQLNSIASQISAIDASYATQLSGNMCS